MATQMFELRKKPVPSIKEWKLSAINGHPKVIKQLNNIKTMLMIYEEENGITDYDKDEDRFYSEDGPYRFMSGKYEWELEQPKLFKEHSKPKWNYRQSPFIPKRIIGIIKEPQRREFIKKMLKGCRNIPVYEIKMDQGVTKPLVGAIPQKTEQVAQEGDMVAALMHNFDQDKVVWMLAVVMLYNEEEDMYGLSDIDPLTTDTNTMYMVPFNNVISLPHYRANPEIAAHALHKVGERVMAVCPGTTFFLIGIIKTQPTKSSNDYTIVLYHPSFGKGRTKPLNVPQRLILSMSTPQMMLHDKY